MPEPVGFLGLGHLGLPVAQSILTAGHPLRAWNRTAAKAKPLADAGATIVDAPEKAAARGGIVCSMLSDDAAVEAVSTEALLDALGPGGVHVSMSTIAPATAKRLAEQHAARGVAYVAAPVFGRPEAAAHRKLWVAVAGPADAKARVRPILDAIGQGVRDVGEAAERANVVKLAGNLVAYSAVEALGAAAALAEANGVARKDLLELLTSTLFATPVYQGYAKWLLGGDYANGTFSATLGRKDMWLAREAIGEPLPMVETLIAHLDAAIADGRGDHDATVLAEYATRAVTKNG